MGRNVQLTDFEKGQILAFIDQKMTVSKISHKLKRSRHVISNFIKNTKQYGSRKSSGRKPIISERTKRSIVNYAKGKIVTSNQIKAYFDIKASKQTILRALNSSGKLSRRKLKRKLVLKPEQKIQRLEFAKKYMDMGEKWQNVIFSDEKKFNLDGPDGFDYYWHTLGSSSPILSKRACGGGSIMIWACFNYTGKSQIVLISGNINSKKYQDILEANLIPFIRAQNSSNVIFQQDNASPHVSKSTLKWLSHNKIETLYWPPYSPDLNPIENMWGVLVQRVYGNGKQFENVDQLMAKILLEWNNMEIKINKSLILSMKNRIFDVISNNGGNTKY